MKRNILFLSVVLVSMALIILEIGVRILLNSKDRVKDAELGWKTVPNVDIDYSHFGEKISYSTSNYGFVTFGKVETSLKKIIVIGDSYTQARYISNENTYHSIINESKKYEMFVYGCDGYSTLQEYLILDRFIDSIKPDIVLLQMCSNDIYNNYYKIEKQSNRLIHLMSKPYLEGNKIVIKNPVDYGFWAVDNVAFIRWFLLKYKNLLLEHTGTPEDNISTKDFIEARDITEKILYKIKKRCKNIPVIAFTTGNDLNLDYKYICARQNIEYFENHLEALDSAQKANIKINYAPMDYHWNTVGHKIVGECIKKYLFLNY